MKYIFVQIDGYQNERDFYEYLNGRKVGELNPLFEELITKLYGKVSREQHIKAELNFERKKYDLLIEVNGIAKRISIKKGVNNSVHSESLSSFVIFLNNSHIEKRTIINYLKYHYADGTTDGSGSKRISASDYKKKFKNEIENINKQINQPEIMDKAIERFVLQGKNSDIKIDAIIHGTIDGFLWLTSEEVKKIIISKINNNKPGVHFGQLYCQSLQRCLNHNKKAEHRRHFIQIKWYSMIDDIIEYMNETSDERIDITV